VTQGHPGAEQIDAKTSFGEESIAYKLPAGPHFLKTKIYAQRQISLPSAADCAFFPAEVAIAPLAYLTTNPAVGQVPSTATLFPLFDGREYGQAHRFNHLFRAADVLEPAAPDYPPTERGGRQHLPLRS
jgi:hypothetical protein